jgi:hypothetical protein
MRYGLHVAAPPGEHMGCMFDELSQDEQKEVVDSLYPGVRAEARKVLQWIEDGKIVPLGSG